MEEKEQLKHMDMREKRVIKQIETYIQKQAVERAALEKKLQNQRHEQHSNMQVETET